MQLLLQLLKSFITIIIISYSLQYVWDFLRSTFSASFLQYFSFFVFPHQLKISKVSTLAMSCLQRLRHILDLKYDVCRWEIGYNPEDAFKAQGCQLNPDNFCNAKQFIYFCFSTKGVVVTFNQLSWLKHSFLSRNIGCFFTEKKKQSLFDTYNSLLLLKAVFQRLLRSPF